MSRARLRAAALAIALLALAPARAAEPALRLVADEWMPFNGAPAERLEGYGVEIFSAAFADRAVAYDVMTWKRALLEVREGRADAVIGAERSDAPDFLFPEEEIGRYRVTLFARSDDPWTFESLASLEGRRVGVVRDYTYPDWVEADRLAREQDYDVIVDDNPLDVNLRKLVAGRIDVIPSNPYSLFWKAEQAGLRTRVRAAGVNPQDEEAVIHIAFSPAKPESARHAAQFSEALRAMRGDGRLAAILLRYGLTDWRG